MVLQHTRFPSDTDFPIQISPVMLVVVRQMRSPKSAFRAIITAHSSDGGESHVGASHLSWAKDMQLDARGHQRTKAAIALEFQHA